MDHCGPLSVPFPFRAKLAQLLCRRKPPNSCTNSVCEQEMQSSSGSLRQDNVLPHRRELFRREFVLSQENVFFFTQENVLSHTRDCFFSPKRMFFSSSQCLLNPACFFLVHLRPHYADKQKTFYSSEAIHGNLITNFSIMIQ